MLSTIDKLFWRNGIALGVLIICLWQVRLAFAQSTEKNTVVINFPVQGWYLVSLPVTVADSSVSAIFPTAFGVFGWDNASSRYVRPTTLQTGRGYWVLFGSPTTVVLSGTRFSQFRRHYLPGWHLVGSLIDSVNFANPDDTPDRSVLLPIFAWDVGGQRYYPTVFLEQSYGQWMAVLRECDVTFRASSGMIVAQAEDKSSRQAFYRRFGAMPSPPFSSQPSTAAMPPSLSKLAADNSALFLAGAEFAEQNQILATLQVEGIPQRVFVMPPGSRIEFPDPFKSITAPRPERRLPGERIKSNLPEPSSTTVIRAPEEANTPQPAPNRADQIALQINTIPLHCNVIVDDKMVGQSPLTVYVDRRRSHVVQIFRDGYKEKIKVLDRQFFGNDAIYLLMEKLEPKR